jgi:phosphomethylpyrimidine synthase
VVRAEELDDQISKARKSFDWEKMISLSLDPERAREKRGMVGPDYKKCTMCGELCAMRETLET